MNIVTMALSDKTSFDHVCYREWGYIGIVGIARNHRREKCNIIYCYLSSAEHNKHSTDKEKLIHNSLPSIQKVSI